MKIKLNDFIEKIKEDNKDINVRRIDVKERQIFIIYLPQLTDGEKLSSDVIKPLMQYDRKRRLTVEDIVYSAICVEDLLIDDNRGNIAGYILEGKSLILIDGEEKFIAANTKKVEKRNIESPEIQGGIRAPRDAFNEDLDTNLSLIRKRIKDPAFVADYFVIGKRTKTKVAVLYIKDIANLMYVDEIKKRLKDIKVDGIIESGYIQKFLLKDTFKLFPQTGVAERPDAASANILEGKVCILVDGSNFVLIAPKVFVEYLDSGDDHYENIYFSIFTKLLRFSAITASLTLSAIYVTVVAYHPDLLPPLYILALAASRTTVPVNALVEATIMELVAELLREASIRLPKQIGPAIGIVGTIVIGQAAVSAGLVSPLMVIIIALSTMSSFAVPDISIINPLRVLKFFNIFIAGIFGLLGLVLGLTAIMINLISTKSFGIPYGAPIAPFNFNDLKKYILSDIKISRNRPKFLDLQDDTRQKTRKQS